MKKISFSCYIKCNTSHFNEKNIYFFKKKDFSVFFPFISMFWMKMKEKARNILTFHGNSFFSLKIAWIIPFPAFLRELTSYLLKTLYFSSEKRNICNFTNIVSFHWKSSFFDDILLISLFSSNNKQKTLNIATIYFFSEKKK